MGIARQLDRHTLSMRDKRGPLRCLARLNAHELGAGGWRSLMNAFPSSFSESRRELFTSSFTGVVPAACDAEAGEPVEVVHDRTALPPAVLASTGSEISVQI